MKKTKALWGLIVSGFFVWMSIYLYNKADADNAIVFKTVGILSIAFFGIIALLSLRRILLTR
jgi:protein tyrosine/serine phosphatase